MNILLKRKKNISYWTFCINFSLVACNLLVTRFMKLRQYNLFKVSYSSIKQKAIQTPAAFFHEAVFLR